MRKITIRRPKQIVLILPQYRPLHVLAAIATIVSLFLGKDGLILASFIIGLALGAETKKTAEMNPLPSYKEQPKDQVEGF